MPLDAEGWDRLAGRCGFDPAREAERRDLLGATRRAVDETLTARRHAVFVAIVLNEVPLDTLAPGAGLQPQRIYQTLSDAWPKLRAAFAAQGYIDDDWTRSS